MRQSIAALLALLALLALSFDLGVPEMLAAMLVPRNTGPGVPPLEPGPAPDGGSARTCYFPAGNIAYDNVPCQPQNAQTHCCSGTQYCLANGLCRVNLDPGTTEFARGACTDKDWNSPACPQQCKACRFPHLHWLRYFLVRFLGLTIVFSLP